MGLRSEEILFLSRWLRAPLRTGSVRPSGRNLTGLIADAVSDIGPDDWIVELGGGTGAVTRALLETGISAERLVVLERDRALSVWLRRAFPRVTVITGDAEHLGQHLNSDNRETPRQIRHVVSSLPLLSLPRGQRKAILAGIFAVLAPEGSLVQYSYGPACPVPRPLRVELGISARAVGTAWRNLPPARVWELTRLECQAQDASRHAA